MTNAIHIARRELVSFLLSPIAYIALVVFYVVFGFLFYFEKTGGPYARANMDGTFFWSTLILVLMIPVLTMRLISEERRVGTLEGLLTAPVTHTALVLGKFLGALAFFIILLLPSLLHSYVLFHFSTTGPDAWRLVSGYLGLLLLGCFMLSFGLFCSSLTRLQVIAALIGIVMLFLFWLLGFFLHENPPATLTDSISEHVFKALYRAAKFVAYERHFDSFLSGALDLRDIIFFVSFTIFFLFLAVCVVANRKWR